MSSERSSSGSEIDSRGTTTWRRGSRFSKSTRMHARFSSRLWISVSLLSWAEFLDGLADGIGVQSAIIG